MLSGLTSAKDCGKWMLTGKIFSCLVHTLINMTQSKMQDSEVAKDTLAVPTTIHTDEVVSIISNIPL